MKQQITIGIEHIQRIVFAALCLCLGCMSCAVDEDINNKEASGDAVRIIASMPEDGATKAADQTKREFAKGDIIHVSATFTFAASTTITTSSAYACMKFDGTNWTATEDTHLNWPWNAVSATFSAYFIPGVTSAMAVANDSSPSTITTKLSDLSKWAIQEVNPQDPLIAVYADVPVGSSVYLQFNHLCTKLTFIKLDQVKKDQELYISATIMGDELVFTRSVGNVLKGEFSQPAGSVMSRVGDGDEITFLLPPIAAKAEIKLTMKDNSGYHSFTLPEKLKKGLVAGKHYTVDITQLSDFYIDEALKEELWNASTSVTLSSTADINAYLSAIRDGKGYTCGGTKVLQVYKEEESGGKNVVAQLVDVDFNNVSFTSVNLSKNITFQGNNHSIKNISIVNPISENATESTLSPSDGDICGALFGSNAGVIKNIVLEGVKTDFTTTEAGDQLAYIGTLAGKNSGTIQNVKLKFGTTGNVITATNKIVDKNFYMGGLVGYNTGTVENVVVSGTYAVTVTNNDKKNISYVGGLLGNAGGVVKNCRIQASSSTIKGSGDGVFYIGGFAGGVSGTHSTDLLSESSTNMTVDATTATEKIDIGGFAGYAANDINTCSATGSVSVVTGLTVAAGGFIGTIENSVLSNCHASGAVQTGNEKIASAYIAGFAGWICNTGTGVSTLLNCSSISAVSAPNAGGFVSTINKGDKVQNSFSKNVATIFITNKNGGTVTNCHHNGKTPDTNPTIVGAVSLNTGIENHADWLRWTDSPAIYGTGIPYLMR